MRIFALVNSDTLAIPSLVKLSTEGKLVGIAVVSSSGKQLISKIKSLGINVPIIILKKQDWEENLRNTLESSGAELGLIFTFPWKLSKHLLESTPISFFNIHFGLLPKYQGPDPIFWQLKNQEKFGGITAHKVTDETDAGPVLLKKEIPIVAGETYGFHCQKVGQLCSDVLDEIIEATNCENETGDFNESTDAKWWDKPLVSDLEIDWLEMSADEIEWLVNATNPKYGGAITSVGNRKLLIKEVTPVNIEQEVVAEPGTIVMSDSVYGIIVSCINASFLRITVAEINEGIISGVKLFNLGLHKGHRFDVSKSKEGVR